MPNTTSARKALRQSQARRTKNVSQKRDLKGVLKQFDGLLAGGDTAGAKEQLQSVFKSLDKAAKNGVIKKNKSSRLKSRFSLRLNKATGGGTEG